MRMQRPTTKELLQHKFIKGAKRTSYLTELIERYQEYRTKVPSRPQMYQATIRNSGVWDATMRSDWNFDTVRTSSAMGSFRSMARDLSDLTPEEAYDEADGSLYEIPESIDTGAATKGSDVPTSNIGAIAMNSQAGHSTMVIRPIASPPKDIPELLADSASGNSGDPEPSTPPQGPDHTEPPPAYSGSLRSSRRASYSARNNLNTGTVLGEADLGNGVDTIRPVKKVDTVRSLRMSAEYVGSLRKEPSESGSVPSSPQSTKSKPRTTSDAAKAGRAMVDDVLVPIFEKVRFILGPGFGPLRDRRISLTEFLTFCLGILILIPLTLKT